MKNKLLIILIILFGICGCTNNKVEVEGNNIISKDELIGSWKINDDIYTFKDNDVLLINNKEYGKYKIVGNWIEIDDGGSLYYEYINKKLYTSDGGVILSKTNDINYDECKSSGEPFDYVICKKTPDESITIILDNNITDVQIHSIINEIKQMENIDEVKFLSKHAILSLIKEEDLQYKDATIEEYDIRDVIFVTISNKVNYTEVYDSIIKFKNVDSVIYGKKNDS